MVTLDIHCDILCETLQEYQTILDRINSGNIQGATITFTDEPTLQIVVDIQYQTDI